jgi:hypothetical protein
LATPANSSFATESGKSKGQFYTPAEVSRVIAKIVGIHDAVTSGPCGPLFFLTLGIEAQRRRVDAVPLVGGLWAVGEHVAQMSVALTAQHLHALHEKAVIGFGAHVFLGGGGKETRPAAAGIELLVASEQRGAAADATVRAGFVVVPIPPGEGALGALLTRYRVLLRRQLLPPFRIGFFGFLHFDSLPLVPIIGESDHADAVGTGRAEQGRVVADARMRAERGRVGAGGGECGRRRIRAERVLVGAVGAGAGTVA